MRKKKDKAEGAQEPGKKMGKKKLIMILVPVLLLAVGGYFIFGKSGSAAAKPAPIPGAILKLEPIYLNLSDGHYLKLGLALQETTLAAPDIDGSKALDAAIALFSQISMTQLSTPDGRDMVKKRLIKKVQDLYAEEVMSVYYTEFVMQ